MNPDLLKLLVIFASILIMLRFKLPLYVSILSGTAVAAIAFQLSPQVILQTAWSTVKSPITITSVVVIYFIALLEHLLKLRGRLDLAQTSLTGLFNSNRINASFAPMFIGLLPSPGSVIIAAPFVENATKDVFGPKENAFIANYFRHIPESFLPVYTTTIVAVQISNQPLGGFLLLSLPMVAALYFIGYMIYIRKIPKGGSGEAATGESKSEYAMGLIKSTWPIFLIIALVLIFKKLNINFAVLIAIGLFMLIYKVSVKELLSVAPKAFNLNLLLATASAMLFKDIVTATGVVSELPGMFEALPIPPFIIFGIIFFFGTIVAGLMAMINLVIPIAFSTISGAGLPLLVFLMYFGFAGGLLNPTHVCLLLCSEHFKIELGDLLKKTAGPIAIFLVVATLYYLGLNLVM